MFYKGILRSIEAGTYTAAVEIVDSPKDRLTAVTVARNIAAEIVARRDVVVACSRRARLGRPPSSPCILSPAPA
ncbi:MAG: hypothetical protein Q7O66_03960 [Dehalococcoidia bacterium]|nr:hypothetical protein [Dehalococcoidia bacterium]